MKKRNLLDKAISYVSPALGRKRMTNRAFEAYASSFTGAENNKGITSVWNPKALSADGDSIKDIPKLRERSRDAVRNLPIGKSVIDVLTDSVIDTGLKFQSTVNNNVLNLSDSEKEKLENQIENEWLCWSNSKDADIARINDFQSIQRLAYRSYLENGDSFALITKNRLTKRRCNLAIQLIEADRISNPNDINDKKNLTGGIEKNEKGTHIRYHIANRLLISTIQDSMSREWRSINKFDKFGRVNLIHVFKQLRIEQTRGIPYLSTVLETLHKIGKLQESELTSALVESLFTVFIKSQDGESTINPFNMTKKGNSSLPDDVEMGSGSMIQLPDGVDINIADPKRPNSKFEAFFYAMVKVIGSTTGIPFEILLKQFNSSFSASKAAIIVFWQLVNRERQFFNNCFNNIILERVIEDGILNNRIDAPLFLTDEIFRKAYTQGVWHGTSKMILQPLEEVKSAVERINARLSNRAAETMTLTGQRFLDNQKQLEKEENLINQNQGIIVDEKEK